MNRDEEMQEVVSRTKIVAVLDRQAVRNPGYPYGEFSAMKWVDEFLRIFPNGTNDPGTLLGWFANAIMTGYDAR